MALYSWYLNNSKGNNLKTKQAVCCNNWPIAKVENKPSNTFKVSSLAQNNSKKMYHSCLMTMSYDNVL